MRVLIFFDLPTETAKDRRNYNKFRKFLINEGFIMMQESVYSKLALNQSIVNSIHEKIVKHKAPAGIIQMLTITEKQFNSIEYITGDRKVTNVYDNTERLVIL